MKWMNEWMSEWMSEWMNVWMNEWVNEWVNEMKWNEMKWNEMKWMNEWNEWNEMKWNEMKEMKWMTLGVVLLFLYGLWWGSIAVHLIQIGTTDSRLWGWIDHRGPWASVCVRTNCGTLHLSPAQRLRHLACVRFSHRGATLLATSLAQLLRHLVFVGSPLLWHCDDFDIDRSRCGAVWILNFPRSSSTSSRQIPCWAKILHRYVAKRSGRNLGHVSYQEILLRSCQVILRRDPAQVFPKRSMFFAQDLL